METENGSVVSANLTLFQFHKIPSSVGENILSSSSTVSLIFSVSLSSYLCISNSDKISRSPPLPSPYHRPRSRLTFLSFVFLSFLLTLFMTIVPPSFLRCFYGAELSLRPAFFILVYRANAYQSKRVVVSSIKKQKTR